MEEKTRDEYLGMEIPTPENIKKFELRKHLPSLEEQFPEPTFVLEYKGIGFCPLGGIQAVTGHKKNGKTFLVAQLMAAILNPDSERMRAMLPGLRRTDEVVEKLGHEPRVLYVDTEMEKLFSAKVIRRVHWLCEWDLDKNNERLTWLWLRDTGEANDGDTKKASAYRWKKMLDALDVFKPDVVFIDGLRDMVTDFNSPDESMSIINNLMSIATRRNICAWNVLHYNPRPGKNSDETKMRGHLGTELGNKVSDTLVCTKDKKGGAVKFTVEQVDARGKDIDKWEFEVVSGEGEIAGRLGVPRMINLVPTPQDIARAQGKTPPDDLLDIREWIDKARRQYGDDYTMSRKEAKEKIFKEIGGVGFNDKLQADLEVAINEKLLVLSTEKKGGAYMLTFGEDADVSF